MTCQQLSTWSVNLLKCQSQSSLLVSATPTFQRWRNLMATVVASETLVESQRLATSSNSWSSISASLGAIWLRKFLRRSLSKSAPTWNVLDTLLRLLLRAWTPILLLTPPSSNDHRYHLSASNMKFHHTFTVYPALKFTS